MRRTGTLCALTGRYSTSMLHCLISASQTSPGALSSDAINVSRARHDPSMDFFVLPDLSIFWTRFLVRYGIAGRSLARNVCRTWRWFTSPSGSSMQEVCCPMEPLRLTTVETAGTSVGSPSTVLSKRGGRRSILTRSLTCLPCNTNAEQPTGTAVNTKHFAPLDSSLLQPSPSCFSRRCASCALRLPHCLLHPDLFSSRGIWTLFYAYFGPKAPLIVQARTLPGPLPPNFWSFPLTF